MTCRQGAAAVLRIAFGYTIMRVKKELIYTFPAAHQATLAEDAAPVPAPKPRLWRLWLEPMHVPGR
jgi:hypothetical protein